MKIKAVNFHQAIQLRPYHQNKLYYSVVMDKAQPIELCYNEERQILMMKCLKSNNVMLIPVHGNIVYMEPYGPIESPTPIEGVRKKKGRPPKARPKEDG